MNTSDIKAALRAKFPMPEYAIMFEVRNSTGFSSAPSTGDALIMGLWPSRGLLLTGVEIKASRSDWLRELKLPQKAEPIMQFCDRWYLAVGDAEIVQPGELPATWGLIVPGRRGLQIIKEAPPLTPEPIDRLFLASLIRHVTDPAKMNERAQELLKEQRDELEKTFERRRLMDRDHVARELKQLRAALDEFEAKSGIQISEWQAGRLGEAVKMVMDGGIDHIKKDIGSMYFRLGQLIAEHDIEIDADA